MSSSVQEASAAALASSTSGTNGAASNTAVRTVQTDSLKATSKSGF